jgi:hypothetical protein
MSVLRLQSEQYSPSGNMAADGFKKLLGTPTLDLLRVLVREAIQNSCDAAKYHAPQVRFRLRELTAVQAEFLDTCVFAEIPESGHSKEQFEAFKSREKRWVLEICDFGTTGLTGPVRADRIPEDCDDTDFVDFARNIGSRRNTHEGGGTYGYGKSSLYLASACSSILIDSCTVYQGENVRRILGCHLGEAFESADGSGYLKRYTGRHWWGVVADDGVADPVEGEAAVSIADRLGICPRSSNDIGTTIAILDPCFLQGEEPESADVIIRLIYESVLWFFWPRMMRTTEAPKKLIVKVELNGQTYSLIAPEDYPPLDLYCAAMNKLRNGGDAVPVWSQRPKQLLGRYATSLGMSAKRIKTVPRDKSIIPKYAHHIALMRPVELVVKYLPGEPMTDDRFEWAGVFICDHSVEAAFAAAEPPAHDDWVADNLPKGHNRTFVNVALRELNKLAFSGGRQAGISSSAEEGPSMAKVSGLLGQFLGKVADGGATASIKRTTPAKKKARKISVTHPEPAGLELVDGKRVALFRLNVINGDELMKLEFTPSIAMDGGAKAYLLEGVKSPEVQGWEIENGNTRESGSIAVIEQGLSVTLLVKVLLYGSYGVGLDVAVEV